MRRPKPRPLTQAITRESRRRLKRFLRISRKKIASISVTKQSLVRYRAILSSLTVLLIIVSIVGLSVFRNQNTDLSQATLNTMPVITYNSQSMIDGSVTNDINGSQPTREIDWVKSPSMSNNNLDIDGSIVEEIDSSQIFKGGIDIPNGWKVQYSTDPNGTPSDQRVFNDYDLSDQQLNPLASIRYLKFTTTTASGFKPYTSTEVKPYQEVALTKAAPDAKQLSSPILFNDKIYSIVRAARASQADSYHLECFDTRQNQRCVSDITFPAYFSSQDATFASPTKLNTGIKDINTSRYFEPVLDDGTYGHPGRVYIPAGNSSNNYGIYCVDLSTHENCGYTSMGTTTKAVSATANNPTLITGFVQKDGKIYGHANDWDTVSQTMICFDITTGSQCPGYSSSTVAQVRTMFSTEHADKYETSGIHAIYGDNMYWVVPYLHGNINHSAFFWDAEIDAKTQRHRGYVLACYNIINRTNCGPDFTAISPRYFSGDGIGSSTTYGFVGDIQIANNPGSGEPEVCMIFNSVIFASHAYDTRILCKGIGSVKSTANTVRNTIHRPANFQGVTIIRPPTSTPDNEATQAWRIGGKGITITDKEGHVKTYSPWHYGPHASMGMTSCYDWTTDESCANFPYFKSWTGVNNYGNGDMGYVYDGVCIIGLGAQGYIWSFNPGDGTTPCRSKRETFSATIQKEDFYCDGASRSIGWGILKLSKANPYDFKNLPVKVYTSAGGTLLGEVDIREDGYMDLSDSIYQVYDTLHVEVEPQFHNKSPWSNGSIPLITASATGDNIQFCYKTELKTYADGLKCNIQQSRTNSELSFENNTKDLYAHATAEIDITQDPEKQCFKDLKAGLTLNKSQVGYAETFEVKANIENKANTDPLGLGNIPSIEDTDLMTIDITIPNGITVISTSPSGGIYSSGKVRWSNQSIDARTSKEYIVEAKTPDTSAFFNNSTHSQGKVYAATTQENIPFQVQVSYQNDIYQNDNSANNTLVFNKISSPEPNNPINPANPPAPSESNQPTPSNPSSAPAPTTAEPTEPNDNDEDNLNDGQDTNQNQANDQETRNNDSSVNNNRSTRRSTSEPRPEPARTYTPAVINAVLPGTLEQPAERVFSTIGKSVASIPQGVAQGIPFGIISLLAILALVYVFEAYKEINTRRIASKIITKLKRNETMTNEFIQIISHHLTTPIATIAGAVELLQNKNELTSDVLGEMSQSINTLQGHSNAILNYSFSQAPSNKSVPMISFASLIKTRSIILPVIGVLLLAQSSNILFGWAGNYNNSASMTSMQVAFFTLCSIALVSALSVYKNQQIINKLNSEELNTQRSLNASQNTLIQEIDFTLSNDISSVEKFVDIMTSTSSASSFKNGVNDLKQLHNKMRLINSAHQASSQAAILHPIDIRNSLNTVMSELNPMMEAKNIKTKINITDEGRINISHEHLYLLLKSIIKNAIIFNTQDGSINISTQYSKNMTIIQIEDTGIGIEKDKINNIFKPFYRAVDSTVYNYEGVGLDLYVCKAIVDNLNGSIQIESQPGDGTKATVHLR